MPKKSYTQSQYTFTVREIHEKLLQICSYPQIWSGPLVKGPLIYGLGLLQGGDYGGLDAIYVCAYNEIYILNYKMLKSI